MRKVLIVNDSRFESLILKDMIGKLGYVAYVSDEYNAGKLIDEIKPQYLIVNLIMKETRGDIFIANIKWRFPHIKCILTSCNEISMRDYDRKIISNVLQTPISMKELETVFMEN